MSTIIVDTHIINCYNCIEQGGILWQQKLD